VGAKFDTDRLLKAVDGMDPDEFAAMLTQDATFTFGNADPARGRQAIQDAVAGFFGSIRALHHEKIQEWEGADDVVTEGCVSYTRHDGSAITLPFVNVLRLDGELVRDYRIYVDIAPLYAV
jgi:ketosteroid isomerase-like protein